MELEFHSMKRKQLQALCKKHGIPANLTNLEMANRLSSLLKETEPSSSMNLAVNKIDSAVVRRETKKVRFSSVNETFIFVQSEAEATTIRKRPWRRKTSGSEAIPISSDSETSAHKKPVRKRRVSKKFNSSTSENVDAIEKPPPAVETTRWNLRRRGFAGEKGNGVAGGNLEASKQNVSLKQQGRIKRQLNCLLNDSSTMQNGDEESGRIEVVTGQSIKLVPEIIEEKKSKERTSNLARKEDVKVLVEPQDKGVLQRASRRKSVGVHANDPEEPVMKAKELQNYLTPRRSSRCVSKCQSFVPQNSVSEAKSKKQRRSSMPPLAKYPQGPVMMEDELQSQMSLRRSSRLAAKRQSLVLSTPLLNNGHKSGDPTLKGDYSSFNIENPFKASSAKTNRLAEVDADGCRDETDEAGLELFADSEGANNAMDKGILYDSHIPLASETSAIQNNVVLDEENGMPTAARIARAGTVTDGGGCIMFPLEGSKSDDTCSPQLLESLEGRDGGELVMNTVSDDANHACTSPEENAEGESFARDDSPDPSIPSWLMDERPPEVNTMKEIAAVEVDVEDCSVELFKAGSMKTNNHAEVDADGDRCRVDKSYSANEAVSMMIDSVTNGEQSNDLNAEQHDFVDKKKDTELCPSPGLLSHAKIEEISSSVDNTCESHGTISEVMTSSGMESDCLLQISALTPGSEQLGVEREETAVFQEWHSQDSIDCSCQEEIVGTLFNEMTPNAAEAYAGEASDEKTHADSKLDYGEDRVENNDEYQEISPDSCAADNIMDEGPHKGSHVQFTLPELQTIRGDDMDESCVTRLEVTTSLVKGSECSLQIHEMIPESEPTVVENGETGPVLECWGQDSADGCSDDTDEAGIKLSADSEGANSAMDKGILDNSHVRLASKTSESQNDVVLDEENGMPTAARIARAGTVTDGGGCIMFPLEGSKSDDTCSPQLLESLEGRDGGEQVMNTVSDDANHVCTSPEDNGEGEGFARDDSLDPSIPSWLMDECPPEANTMKEIPAAKVDVEDCAGSKYSDQCDEEFEKMSNDGKYCSTNPREENSSFQLGELFKAGSVKTNNHAEVGPAGDRCRVDQSYSVNEAVSMMIDSVTNGEQCNDLNLEQHDFVDQKKDTELCRSPGLPSHAKIKEISSSVDNTYESRGTISEAMTSSGKESDCLLQISALTPGSEPFGVEREEATVFQECHSPDSIDCSCQEEIVGFIFKEMTPNAAEAYAGEAIDGKTHADTKLDDGEDRVENNDAYQEISPDSCAADNIKDEGPPKVSHVQFTMPELQTIEDDEAFRIIPANRELNTESHATRLEVSTSLVKGSECSLQIYEMIPEIEPIGVEKGETGTVQGCCGQDSAYLVSNAAEICASEAHNGAKRDDGEDTDEMDVEDPIQDTAVSSIVSLNDAVYLEIQNNFGQDSLYRSPSSHVNDFLEGESEVFTGWEMRLFSSGVPKKLENEPTGSQQKHETERSRHDTQMIEDLIDMTDSGARDLVVSKDLVVENEDPKADGVPNLEDSGNAMCSVAFLYDKKPHKEEENVSFPDNSTDIRILSNANSEDDSTMIKECSDCDNEEDISCKDSVMVECATASTVSAMNIDDKKTRADTKLDDGEDRVENNYQYQEISPDSCAAENVIDEGPHKGSHVQFTSPELQTIQDGEAFHIIPVNRELNTEGSNIIGDTIGGDDMDESCATRLEVMTSLVKGSELSLQIHEMIPESEQMGVEIGETGIVQECCGQDSAYLVSNAAEICASEAHNGAKRDDGEDTDEMDVEDPIQDTAVSSIVSLNDAVYLEIQNNFGQDSLYRSPSSHVNDFLEGESEVFTGWEMRLFSSGVPKKLENEPTGSQQKHETESRHDTQMIEDLIDMTDSGARGDLVVSKDLVVENEDPVADEVPNLEDSGIAVCSVAFLYDKKPHKEEENVSFPENSTNIRSLSNANCEDDSTIVKEHISCKDSRMVECATDSSDSAMNIDEAAQEKPKLSNRSGELKCKEENVVMHRGVQECCRQDSAYLDSNAVEISSGEAANDAKLDGGEDTDEMGVKDLIQDTAVSRIVSGYDAVSLEIQDSSDRSPSSHDDRAAEEKQRLSNDMISSTVGSTEGRQEAIAVTPKKPMNILDMKENIVSSKRQQQLGSLTPSKSVAKRQPLKDLQQKLI